MTLRPLSEKGGAMTKEPIDLDKHRGMTAQNETEQRRNRREVQEDERGRRHQRDELEQFLSATPAQSWAEAAEKARYLLGLFALTPEGMDPRHEKLIQAVFDDFDRLLGMQATDNDNDA
jgi:hypothetical protein